MGKGPGDGASSSTDEVARIKEHDVAAYYAFIRAVLDQSFKGALES
jgi:hypothetical protein